MQISNLPVIELGVIERQRHAAVWETGTAYEWSAHQTLVYSIFLLAVWMKPVQSVQTPTSIWKQQIKASNSTLAKGKLKKNVNDTNLSVMSGIWNN